jgi:hypothetical protein
VAHVRRPVRWGATVAVSSVDTRTLVDEQLNCPQLACERGSMERDVERRISDRHACNRHAQLAPQHVRISMDGRNDYPRLEKLLFGSLWLRT